MAELGDLKIPAATRPAAEAIIGLTDQVAAPERSAEVPSPNVTEL